MLLLVATIIFATVRPARPAFVAVFAVIGFARVASIAVRPAAARLPNSGAESPVSPHDAGPDSPAEVLQWALLQAMRLSGGTSGSIMLLDPGSGTLRIAAAHGLPDDIVSTVRIRPGEGIAGLVLRSGHPMIVEDSPHRERSVRREDVRSAVSVPISDEHLVVGVLNVGHPHHPTRITDEQLDQLRVLGSRIASALADRDPAIEHIIESL